MRFLQFPNAGTAPRVAAFRRRFHIDTPSRPVITVSADERYELFLDGNLIGRGPTRGDAKNWFYETYELDLAPGPHELVARVAQLGPLAPAAQIGVEAGFGLAVSESTEPLGWLATENEGWETQELPAWGFETGPRGHFPWFTGPNYRFDCDKHDPEDGWQPAVPAPHIPFAVSDPARVLRPSPLPLARAKAAMRGLGQVRCIDENIGQRQFFAAEESLESASLFKELSRGGTITIPPNRRFRVLFDLEDYLCAFPHLRFEGGRQARLALEWAEALEHRCEDGDYEKGRRDQIDGLHFLGPQGDTVWPDGRAFTFSPLWWRCGRFLKLEIETQDAPLTIHSLQLEETRYPLEITGEFRCDSPAFQAIFPPSIRALEVCSHETFMDCPYYEQLQYVGDTRLQALVTYVLSADDRLIRHALQSFDASRDASGFTRSRYPSSVPQTIPPFSLWWIWMLHDFAFWRDDAALVSQLLPGARAIADGFLRGVDSQGLLCAPPGWNFLDWVSGWPLGVPGAQREGGEGEVTAALQWHLVGTLERLAQLESEPELVARWRRHARQLAASAEAYLWDEERGAFRDALTGDSYSEHAQALAILSGHLSPEKQAILAGTLVQDAGLKRASIYFSHYVFEALRALDLTDEIWPRLEGWYSLESLDLKTTPEQFSSGTRSDCHAWGAHPVFHAHATFAGVRPLDRGFKTIEIAPQFGALTQIQSTLPHPLGRVVLDLQRDGTSLKGQVTIPRGTKLEFKWKGQNLCEVTYKG